MHYHPVKANVVADALVKMRKRWIPNIQELKDEILHKTHSPRY